MRGIATGVIAAVLAVAVTGLWVLRTEPTGPLLSVPTPDRSAQFGETPADINAVGAKGFPPPAFDEIAANPSPDHSAVSPRVSENRKKEVREIIRRLRPDHSPDAIEVWVEEMAHLPDEEISFLMSQSEAMIGLGEDINVLDESQAPLSTDDELFVRPSLEDVPDATESPYTPQTTIRRNLRNVTTIGYRDTVEISVMSAGTSSAQIMLSTPRLTCGSMVRTGDPHHLALETPGLVFFRLEDGRLTRNGTFRRMDDGRLGLPADDTFVALRDSPILPEDQDWTVATDGRITTRGGKELGVINVVEVGSTTGLTSENGVYFRTSAETVPATGFRVISGALELSNVDVDQNRQLLEAFATAE